MYERSTYLIDADRDPNLRAGDVERDAISDRLRRSHAEGRLDTEEFQERIDRCYQAKTVGELELLVGDLPAPAAAARPLRSRRLRMIPLVPVLVLVLVASTVIAHDGGFWVLFPLFFMIRFWLWPRRRGHRGFAPGSEEPRQAALGS